ncbi:hypothetical protein OG592_42125 (plasmid) [Streptomyces avidinii]|uniref:hypothetical protein n=1 Tax=Streptomyces avidinii TaxID=1895 RepID=UPI002F9154B2|nr:hypothetical protein OG592_42125 [Streptomyces avidinii]
MSDTSPDWAKPAPLGYGSTSDAAHFVAAPLLAGACIATIGVLGADGDKFRWPGPAMLMLTLAFVALIASVQYGFHARQHFYSPADVDAWYPPGGSRPAESTLRQRQQRDFQQWRRLSRRGSTAYNVGVVLLGAAATLVLAPPEDASLGHAVCRWTAAAVTALGSVAEFEWILRGERLRRFLARATHGPTTGRNPHD